MRQQGEFKFYSSRNYKNGKYIMSKYRLQDFIIMVGSIAGAVFLLGTIVFSSDGSNRNILWIMLGILAVASMPLLLFNPVMYYFNFITWIGTYFDFYTRNKTYIWEGIVYEKDDEKAQTEEQS